MSWCLWPAYALGVSPEPFLPCGPLVAALAVIGVTERPVATFAITFVYQWLFHHTGASVLMTMTFHIAQGTVSYAALGFAGADADRMDSLTGALWCAVALAVIVLDPVAWRAAPPSATADKQIAHTRC